MWEWWTVTGCTDACKWQPRVSFYMVKYQDILLLCQRSRSIDYNFSSFPLDCLCVFLTSLKRLFTSVSEWGYSDGRIGGKIIITRTGFRLAEPRLKFGSLWLSAKCLMNTYNSEQRNKQVPVFMQSMGMHIHIHMYAYLLREKRAHRLQNWSGILKKTRMVRKVLLYHAELYVATSSNT